MHHSLEVSDVGSQQCGNLELLTYGVNMRAIMIVRFAYNLVLLNRDDLRRFNLGWIWNGFRNIFGVTLGRSGKEEKIQGDLNWKGMYGLI